MTNSTKMREPEWLVFLRTVLLGAVLAEIFQIGMLSGATWGRQLADDGGIWPVIVGTPLILLYLCLRITRLDAWRIISSGRIDLAVLFLAGARFDHLLTPELATFHDAVSKLDAGWSQAMLVVLLMMLMSPVIRHWWPFIRPYAKQLMVLMAPANEAPRRKRRGIWCQNSQMRNSHTARFASPPSTAPRGGEFTHRDSKVCAI